MAYNLKMLCKAKVGQTMTKEEKIKHTFTSRNAKLTWIKNRFNSLYERLIKVLKI